MKNYLKYACLTLVLLFLFSPSVLNAQSSQILRIRINGAFLYIPANEQQPIMQGDVLVPLRVVLETLGYAVEWRAETQTAVFSKQGRVGTLEISSQEIFINNRVEQLYIPSQLVSGRTMVSLCTIYRLTGMNVLWERNSYTINIFDENSFSLYMERPISPLIQTSISEIELGLSPEYLIKSLYERDIKLLIPPYYTQDWDFINKHVENPVLDGRIYNLGGLCFSFFFRTEHLVFNFTREGEKESIFVRTAEHSTFEGIRIGDSRDRVVEAHGHNYLESPFASNVIEYFDGENYLSFVFGGDKVIDWSIRKISIFDSHARILLWR